MTRGPTVIDPTTGLPASFTAQTTYVPLYTPAQCAAAATATSPTDPNFKTVTTTVSRRTTEVGPRLSEFTTTVFDYKAGVRGKITEHLDYDVYGAYGESENLQNIQNYVLTSRARAAAYATNTATCLPNPPNGGSTTAGCVPVNLFGPAGSITQAQAAYLTANSTTRIRTQLGQVHAQLSGDFGVTSPAATDPISFAVGGEYRKYRSLQAADVLSQTAGELGGAGGAVPNFNGSFSVREGFGELVVPLVQDKPGIQSLTVNAGVRYSDYRIEAAGTPSFNTTTYKGEVAYEPGFGLKLRGNYARASRAPNINELFNPVTTGLTNLSVDPCASVAPNGNPFKAPPSGNLAAVCLAQGANATNLSTIGNPTAGQANETSGGNPNIRPETSYSYGGGVVFAPKFVRGVSLSVDYYHITVDHAITTPVPGDAINACFGNLTAASATSAACTAIVRNPVTGQLDGDPATTPGLSLPESNSGRLRTSGIDVTANFSHDFHVFKLGVSATGNYTFESKFQSNAFTSAALPNAGLDRECVGYYSVNCSFTGSLQPKWQTAVRSTLGFDSFDISLLWRHIDAFNQEPDDVANGNGPAFSGMITDPKLAELGHFRAKRQLWSHQTVRLLRPLDPDRGDGEPVADDYGAEHRQPQAADCRLDHWFDRVQQRQHLSVDLRRAGPPLRRYRSR